MYIKAIKNYNYWLILSVLLIGLLFLSCTKKGVESKTLNLVVAPTSIQDDGWEDGTQPRAVNVIVSSNTGDEISYRATESASWISLFGDTIGTTPDTFTVMMGVGGLLPGNIYVDTIRVEATRASNSPVTIEASLTVKFIVEINPDTLLFTALSGGDNPSSQQLTINHFKDTPFSYSLSHSQSWLNLSKTSGSSPDSVNVDVNINGLGAGEYSDSIIVDVPFSANSPVIYCLLTVVSWEHQIDPVGHDLKGVTFVDDSHGWAVGQVLSAEEQTGYILATTNGGKNWSVQSLEIPHPLGDVQFFNTQTGIAVGGNGLIVKTVNGGMSWSIIPNSDTINLVGLYFPDPAEGWVVGGQGTIFHTTDTGSTWTVQESGSSNDLIHTFFINTDSGWVVGNSGTVLFTANGGANWSDRSVGAGNDLRDIYFIDNRTGWVVGDAGSIFHTTDAGISWTQQTSPSVSKFQGVTFVDSGHGWIVGKNGTILFTNDGSNWTEQFTRSDEWLFDVIFTDDSNGWVVGGNGTILHTVTGGL